MLEDELRKTFEELNVQPRPRTFGAVDIVFHGQRVKRRRRGYAVAATGAGTAALVVVAVTFALNQTPGPSENTPANPPHPTTHSTTSTTPPDPTSIVPTPGGTPPSTAVPAVPPETTNTSGDTVETPNPNATTPARPASDTTTTAHATDPYATGPTTTADSPLTTVNGG
ncbi:hypothetical protein ACFFSW_24345 [Saccharothrix longispora]|uniref:Cytoskeletal protein RodZ n=1 Tax=Saccharothrix longispora TaxID=33920 RepID=A0ABU1PXH2_9PSEU|nr:hypothetical protein [Saccharothrix longispora]MDR6595353.1 cytoskeletal protein RodZ [Saccharothrix longispora]